MHRGRDDRAKQTCHVMRKEIALSNQELKRKASHEWRVEHVERLKSILISGSVATLQERLGRGRLPYLKCRNQGDGFPDFNLNFRNQGGESGDVISKTPTLTVNSQDGHNL